MPFLERGELVVGADDDQHVAFLDDVVGVGQVVDVDLHFVEPTGTGGVKEANSVGITSAASTPDDLVQKIIGFFRERNAELEVVEEGEWEDITFREPKRVAPRPHAG